MADAPTIESTTIHAATLTVRSVMFNREMLSLGVYRQIMPGELFERTEVDGERRSKLHPDAEVWGWVNACPTSKCASASDHVHFIGVRQGRLRHDVVPLWWSDFGFGEGYEQLFVRA